MMVAPEKLQVSKQSRVMQAPGSRRPLLLWVVGGLHHLSRGIWPTLTTPSWLVLQDRDAVTTQAHAGTALESGLLLQAAASQKS